MPPEGGAPALPAAVLWDMDGTLMDTEPYWIQGEHDLVERYGGTWTQEHAHALVGHDLMDSARYIAEHGPVPLEPQQIVELLLEGVVERVREHVPWRPGALRLLSELGSAGVRMALVTSSWTSLADTFLEAAPPGTFELAVTGDRVSRGKPHAEPYLQAATRLGVDPGRCVAVEDSPVGAASAQAAGVPTLVVPHVVAVPQAPGRSFAGTLSAVSLEHLSRIAAGEVLEILGEDVRGDGVPAS